jgi:DNA-binding transcriptional MerR regulator
MPLRAPEMKSPTAFRTISEVATDLAVPQHVLRFWESKFQQIRPLKRGGGRRYYRPEDIQLISSIKDLLYNQGFTIRGVQKLLKENGRFPSARSMVPDPQVPASMSAHHATSVTTSSSSQPAQQRSLSPEKRREIESVLSELKSLRELLRQSGI